tara:strand:+ start:95 stop:487 length:393 start_codon:yes stop_codon:yes gene_type:complete
MTEKGDPVANMSKAEIFKEFGPKILDRFGTDELKFMKEESTGPGGVDVIRDYIRDYFYSRGGMAKKKKMMRGGAVAKKKMRGGGMAKMAKKKKMRGGGSVMPKRMRGGGMAKMASKKKMMRGGMAKKKKK